MSSWRKKRFGRSLEIRERQNVHEGDTRGERGLADGRWVGVVRLLE